MGLLGNLLLRLKEGEVTFEYRKSDGKLRKARGTLNRERIPTSDWNSVKNPNKKVDELSLRVKHFVSYYDLDVGEWRRFKLFSLIKIVSYKLMKDVNKERRMISAFDDEEE